MTQVATMETAAQAENLKLRLSRVIKTSRQRVFDAWTRPEFIQEWFGPAQMIVTSATNDLRVGGEYRIEMNGPGERSGGAEDADFSRRAVASGTYREIVSNEMLSFTWRGDWNPAEETLVTISLRDVEGGTEIVLTHENFHTAESRSKHNQGWTSTLEKLARYCESESE